jgi:hypothetical protein
MPAEAIDNGGAFLNAVNRRDRGHFHRDVTSLGPVHRCSPLSILRFFKNHVEAPDKLVS